MVVPKALDVEGSCQLLFAPEMVIDASRAGPRTGADLLEGGGREPLSREAVKRGLENRPATVAQPARHD